MEPVAPAPNPFYGVLVVKGIAAVTAVLDAVRCVVDSVEAKKVAGDLGLDFAADAGEVILMYLRLTLSNPYGDPGVIIAGGFERYTKDFSRNKTITQSIAAICYGIVYGTWAYINALELLNGLAEPNTGTAFTPDNGQSKFDSIYGILTHADADRSQWSGTGAQNYSDINRDLIKLVQRTAAADTATAHTVQLQADQVKQLRKEIAEIKIILIGLLVLIMAFLGPLNFLPPKQMRAQWKTRKISENRAGHRAWKR
ncbi:MAG: hypothetical protein K2Q25_13905 [Mycobacteriaceae bacterium]|nr:hypothetical protein [Mycobacteriaceae bacterium]